MQGRAATGYEDFFSDGEGGGELGMWWKMEQGDGVFHWMVRPPCGHHFILAHQPESHHHVEEHHDGAITVRPNPPAEPDNSNSVLCYCGWHGFVDHGRWYSV